MDDTPYQISATEKVKELEAELAKDLAELKNEIEENEMVHGITRSVSSVPLPKDINHYRNERKVVLERGLEVCEARPVVIQAQTMSRELDNCFNSDYGIDGLPLLLHQFFLERVQQLVQGKHMHMLRWVRFCEHTSTIESLHPEYNKRLTIIMSEYNDHIQRAQRLSVARECYLEGKPAGAMLQLKEDDLLIYLRWLICHLHSLKLFNQYFKLLQWLPVMHKQDTSPQSPEEKEEDEGASSVRIPSKYNDEIFITRHKDTTSRPPSARSPRATSAGAPIPTPPPYNPTLLTTVPLPASHISTAASAAGGGIASSESTEGIPLHANDFESLKQHLVLFGHLYGIEQDVSKISSSADEMELYAGVNRKFKQVFSKQEHMKTFKTYDRLEIGQENWGADNSMHALKQESNWVPYVKLKAEKDPHQIKKMVELRARNNVDPLLKAQSRFLQVADGEKVQDSLREHAAAVREPITLGAVSVTAHQTAYHTGQIWKRIYTNPELYADKRDELDVALEEFDEKEADHVNFTKSRAASAKKRRESYDYFDAVQLLGLDDGEQSSNDPSSIQGAYLSFLQLRHLRLRDLQRSCLSILNYYRSVERMVTINDEGLSLESSRVKRSTAQSHRKGEGTADGGAGGGTTLGSHHYLHNTPRDFKLNETEFMQFTEVENHDDFYCFEEGRVHVQDARGYYIVYDSAIDDMKTLENDMLLIATHYLEKDKDLRGATGINRGSARRKQAQSAAGDFDIASYSHQEVDRFAVLYDLWTSEVSFQECKKELLDCYMEAYHHIVDRDERRAMAQVITNLIHKQPKFDFSAPYFLRTYRLEAINLRIQTQIVKGLLDKQIEQEREYQQRVCIKKTPDFGMPYGIIPQQPISVNMSRSMLRNIFMLEFHPSLGAICKLPETLRHSYWELFHIHKPETVTDQLVLEKKMLEAAVKEWNKMDPIGSSYSQQTQKDVFADVFVEDPNLVTEIVQSMLLKEEQDSSRKSQKEKHEALLKTINRALEMVTLRYRLLDAAWETEILSKIYRSQAVEMGYDECHLFLRFVQFEFANFKKDAGKAPPVFVTSIQEDDTGIDRYVPNYLYLAIHELDEGHVGRFTMRNRDGVLALLTSSGLESLQTILGAQVVHKNAIQSAVQQANACQPVDIDLLNRGNRPLSPDGTKSEKSSATGMTGFSSATGGTSLGARLGGGSSHKNKKSPEAFVSIQLEKGPSRDLMLNEFVKKKEQMGTVLRNPAKMEDLKRKLIQEYCGSFQQRIAQYSLRSQIISYYNSIMGLLKEFPEIRENYFMLGEANEKKTEMESKQGLVPDARSLRKRPRIVLSQNGTEVINIWFIPHYTELLIMYKKMDDASCKKALSYHLTIVATIHDILQYLCAHSRLGSSQARLGSRNELVSADWGGEEGIGSDLREIQKQIDHLDQSTSPAQVCDFLLIRRDVMFLEFDCAVRHNMRDTYLATGNSRAYNALTDCMHFALYYLSNTQQPSVGAINLNVPEPLEARDAKALITYPWRASLNKGGTFPLHFWQWNQIEYYMQLSLAGLKDVERHVAHGEILGVSLLMEDVLGTGNLDKAEYMADSDEEDAKSTSRPPSARVPTPQPPTPNRPSSRPSSGEKNGQVAKSKNSGKLSRSAQPIESYRLMKSFLLLWKRLEVYKQNWGKHKLQVEHISSARIYKQFCIEYKKDVLYPVLQSVARRYGQVELYEGMVSDSEALVMPRGASEIEIRTRQLIKLMESWECHMISEVRKRLAKELSLVLSERSREENALPTDLWKKPVMKESFTITKPHIAEDFIDELMKQCNEENGDISFKKEHLNKCLNKLASDVMARERHNYENYSMYYENLLRVNHQLLYQKEQEVKQVRNQLLTAQNNTMVEVQCQLADANQDLLMEITALRAKISEMREYSLTQEREIREKVKEEYGNLVQNLFQSAFDLKSKFDEFREQLHQNCLTKISETRSEAMEAMTRLKQRSGIETAEEDAKRDIVHAEKVTEYQEKNHLMTTLLIKLKSLNNWKRNKDRSCHSKDVGSLHRDVDRSKKELNVIKMMAEEELVLYRQQLVALRNALRLSEKECEDLRKELDKELKVKKESMHTAQQRAQSQKQLEEARRANIDKVLEELDDKDSKLKDLIESQEKAKKLKQLTEGKAKKEVTTIKKQLTVERSMKLGAFQRVDELQTQVYDYEASLYSTGVISAVRPQTAIGTMRTKPRSASAKKQRASNPLTDSTGVWPPPVSFPANRNVTSAQGYAAGTPKSSSPVPPSGDPKRIQRPKTTTGRLRSMISEQLQHDLDPPDHHETLLRLQELQVQHGKKGEYVY